MFHVKHPVTQTAVVEPVEQWSTLRLGSDTQQCFTWNIVAITDATLVVTELFHVKQVSLRRAPATTPWRRVDMFHVKHCGRVHPWHWPTRWHPHARWHYKEESPPYVSRETLGGDRESHIRSHRTHRWWAAGCFTWNIKTGV